MTRTPPFVEFTHALTWFTSPCALAIVAMTPMQTTPATLSVSNAHIFIRAPLPGSAGLCSFRTKPDEMPYAIHGPFGPVFALAGPTSHRSLSSSDVLSARRLRPRPVRRCADRAGIAADRPLGRPRQFPDPARDGGRGGARRPWLCGTRPRWSRATARADGGLPGRARLRRCSRPDLARPARDVDRVPRALRARDCGRGGDAAARVRDCVCRD